MVTPLFTPSVGNKDSELLKKARQIAYNVARQRRDREGNGVSDGYLASQYLTGKFDDDFLVVSALMGLREREPQPVVNVEERVTEYGAKATPALVDFISTSLAYEKQRQAELDKLAKQKEAIPAVLLSITSDALAESARAEASHGVDTYLPQAERLIHAMRRRGIIVAR